MFRSVLVSSIVVAVATAVMCWHVPSAPATPLPHLPSRGIGWVLRIERWLPKPDKHIRRANRYLAKCLAPTSPIGIEVHNYDVAQGEFIAWWGDAEYQLGTIQVWWVHWPTRDHNPTLAGVMFSTYGMLVGSDLYEQVDSCTSAAVNRDVMRG